MEKAIFFELIEKYQDGTASAGERQLLEAYYERLVESGIEMNAEEMERVDAAMRGNIEAATGTWMGKSEGRVRKLFNWKRIAAAASVIGIVGLSGLVYYKWQEKNIEPGVAVAEAKDVAAPDKSRASIQLANGKIVYLDSAGNGELAVQGGVRLSKDADGTLSYDDRVGQAQTDNVINTLTNPRGSQVVSLLLADGSKVWLNAGSSVTYPVAFNGSKRKVDITGEAYFEIAHDATKPFTVNKGDVSVQVLGTHFNVNAYDDETALKVTLLEGSVRVASGKWVMASGKKQFEGEQLIIRPGEQAAVNANDGLRTVKNTNMEQVMAWKNGNFAFAGADIKTIMRELSRWYDVDVVYADEIKETFYGKLPRSSNISDVLRILEKTGGVRIEVEGRKVVVRK